MLPDPTWNGVLTPSRWGNRQLVNIQSLAPLVQGGRGACMWRCGDSNPVPPACKAGALPSELHPRTTRGPLVLVGHPGLEPGASVLSGLRSNHLS